MAQYLRPDSDFLTGNFTPSEGTTLWECLDEETPDDGDYIQSDTDEGSTKIGLSEVDDPLSSSGHTVRFRWQSTGSSPPTETATVTLRQGTSTHIANLTTLEATVPRSWATESYTLASGEADLITDYSDLNVQVYINRTGSGEYIQVSWIEMECRTPLVEPRTQAT